MLARPRIRAQDKARHNASLHLTESVWVLPSLVGVLLLLPLYIAGSLVSAGELGRYASRRGVQAE
jgi:hypothetical protein